MSAEIGKWSKTEMDAGINTKAFYSSSNEEYIEERQRLHDEIVDEILNAFEDLPSDRRIVVVSGGSASAKSVTAKLATEFLKFSILINTDEIRTMLPEFALVEGTDKAGLLQQEAGEIRDNLLASSVALGLPIVWDTPGSLSVAEALQAIADDGYLIFISYTHCPVDKSKQMALFRAQNSQSLADRRIVPDDIIEGSHRKARDGFSVMAALKDREVFVCDRTSKDRGEESALIFVAWQVVR